ncbi:HXXEE domain-containing protein [Rhizobium sp. PAMB 3174]
MNADILPYLPLAACFFHLIEEFAWPGGFGRWYAEYRPEIAKSLTVAFLVRINAVMVAVAIWIAWRGTTAEGYLSAWVVLAAILMSNAFFHLRAVWIMRRYSPGVVTGTLLYLPLYFAGVPVLVSHGMATTTQVVFSTALGLCYPLWSLTNHRRRARAG